jgi:hypothetical protein
MTDAENQTTLAHSIAKYLVSQARGQRGRSFSVLEEKSRPVPFSYHWRCMNARGVTFQHNQLNAAEAWITQALLAGYTVFYHIGRRHRFAAGRNLQHSIG